MEVLQMMWAWTLTQLPPIENYFTPPVVTDELIIAVDDMSGGRVQKVVRQNDIGAFAAEHPNLLAGLHGLLNSRALRTRLSGLPYLMRLDVERVVTTDLEQIFSTKYEEIFQKEFRKSMKQVFPSTEVDNQTHARTINDLHQRARKAALKSIGTDPLCFPGTENKIDEVIIQVLCDRRKGERKKPGDTDNPLRSAKRLRPEDIADLIQGFGLHDHVTSADIVRIRQNIRNDANEVRQFRAEMGYRGMWIDIITSEFSEWLKSTPVV